MSHAITPPSFAGSRSLRCGLKLSLSAFLISLIGVSAAQATMIDVPGSVSPGQIEKQFQAAPSAPVSPDLQLLIPGDEEIPQAVQDQLSKQTFVLNSVVVEDATVYKPEALSSTYKDKVGQTISLLDARKIAKAITTLYHNNGYILSQAVVPPQDVTDGVLRIRVVEGTVGAVSIQGELRSERERKVLEGYADQIQAEHPVSLQTLERYLLLINDLPGVTVSGLLRPLPSAFGAAELVLTVEQNRFNGSYTFDNRGSKFIGPWQHTLALSANSLYGMYDMTQARFFFAFPDTDELLGGELSHEVPIGTQGTKLSLLGSYINTKPGDTLKSLDIVGQTTFVQAKVTHPFLRARKENLIGRFMVDYRDTITDVFKDTSYTKDRLRSVRAGGTYTFADFARGNNIIDTQMSQGMDILNASGGGDMRSNAKGSSSYSKFNLDLSRLQPLPYKLSLLVGATGQYALDPLLVDEQFSLGGSEYARAFHAADSLGDHGVAGKTELRYTDTVGLPYFDYYQAYTFYDIGRAWLRDAEAGENNQTVRSSAGTGIRLNFNKNLSSTFEVAVPLIGPPVDSGDGRHSPQFYMSMVARF